ncbi:MAG: DNA polymerase Y family protein, partial [Hyphomicrobiales bacterium]
MSVLSNRRYLSLWLRRLSTDRIERRGSAPAEAFVVVASIKSAHRIAALTDSAARLGLKVGMGLADARAMYPGLPAVDAAPDADRHFLESIADWCDRYTPLVGLDAPDGLLLDVTGCAHLFGGEAALLRDLVARLAQQGLRARAAVADTVGAAWAVARYGSSAVIPDARDSARSGIQRQSQDSAPDSGFTCQRRAPRNDNTFRVVPRGETATAILGFPIVSLRVDPDIAADLNTAGLTCIADLTERPRAPFAARFGKTLLLRLDQALG